MDPEVTLRQIGDMLRSGQEREAREAALDMWEWIDQGGSVPYWSHDEHAARFCILIRDAR